MIITHDKEDIWDAECIVITAEKKNVCKICGRNVEKEDLEVRLKTLNQRYGSVYWRHFHLVCFLKRNYRTFIKPLLEVFPLYSKALKIRIEEEEIDYDKTPLVEVASQEVPSILDIMNTPTIIRRYIGTPEEIETTT